MLRALTLSLLIMPVICSAQTANPVCSDPAVITRIQATLTGEIKRLLRSETEVKLELTEMSITDRFVESEAGIVAKKGANCRASAILDLAGKARSLPGPLSYRTYVGTDTVDINPEGVKTLIRQYQFQAMQDEKVQIEKTGQSMCADERLMEISRQKALEGLTARYPSAGAELRLSNPRFLRIEAYRNTESMAPQYGSTNDMSTVHCFAAAELSLNGRKQRIDRGLGYYVQFRDQKESIITVDDSGSLLTEFNKGVRRDELKKDPSQNRGSTVNLP